jgi:hypothetical protein
MAEMSNKSKLITAIIANSLEDVISILKSSKMIMDEKDSTGCYPLDYAIETFLKLKTANSLYQNLTVIIIENLVKHGASLHNYSALTDDRLLKLIPSK